MPERDGGNPRGGGCLPNKENKQKRLNVARLVLTASCGPLHIALSIPFHPFLFLTAICHAPLTFTDDLDDIPDDQQRRRRAPSRPSPRPRPLSPSPSPHLRLSWTSTISSSILTINSIRNTRWRWSTRTRPSRRPSTHSTTSRRATIPRQRLLRTTCLLPTRCLIMKSCSSPHRRNVCPSFRASCLQHSR